MNTSQFSVSALTFPCWPSTFTTGLGIANNKARWFRRQSGIFLVFEWWRYRKMEMQLFSCLGRRNSLMLVFSVSEGQQPAQKKSLSDVLLSEWFSPQYCRVQMVCLQNEDYSQWAVRSKGSSVTTDPLVYVHAWKWKHGVKWVSSCAQALHLLCQKEQCKPNEP